MMGTGRPHVGSGHLGAMSENRAPRGEGTRAANSCATLGPRPMADVDPMIGNIGNVCSRMLAIHIVHPLVERRLGMNATLGLGVIGLSITLALNVFGVLVLRQAAARVFTDEWWSVWFPSFIVSFVIAMSGLGPQCSRRE